MGSYEDAIPHYHPPDYPLASGYYSSPPVPIDCCSSVAAPSPPSYAAQSSLQNNCVFQRFLDDTWPEKTLRRGSAVIRSTLYERIADTLRGGEATARFKHWVKKSEFFLMEKVVPGMGYGACLAVPAVRARGSAGKNAARHSHKQVARLEDFSQIIANYHNDRKGHSGIRRTYAMIQEDFSYLPRAAVAKYIELCEVCNLHKPRNSTARANCQGMASGKKTLVPADMAAGLSNESFDTGYETSDSRNSTPTFDRGFQS